MELTPTPLPSFPSSPPDAEPDSPPRLQASRSCHPARSESELALCELELDLEEPQGLQRQSSLDSGIPGRKKKGSLAPSPTGSLASSPSASPVRTRESSLHSTPSPVLQRRFTGNRVSVVNEAWLAGPARRAEAGPRACDRSRRCSRRKGRPRSTAGSKPTPRPVRPNCKADLKGTAAEGAAGPKKQFPEWKASLLHKGLSMWAAGKGGDGFKQVSSACAGAALPNRRWELGLVASFSKKKKCLTPLSCMAGQVGRERD